MSEHADAICVCSPPPQHRLNPEGARVQIVKEPLVEAREAVVVMSPFYNLQHPGNMRKFAVLLGRHVQVGLPLLL